jgi:hypothetical protein
VRIGFYTSFERDPIHYVLGRNMIKSVRKVMPDVEIVQLTDQKSAPVYGVDSIRRLPHEPLCLATARHYAHCEGDWLLIDTDTVVQKDVRHVFDGATWDFAITDRVGTLVPGETLFPWCGNFNIGVVFQRNGKAFWSAVVDGLLKATKDDRHWMGNQIVASKVLEAGGLNYTILPGLEFNYAPKARTDDVSHASIVHYKGPTRKKWLYQQCASA